MLAVVIPDIGQEDLLNLIDVLSQNTVELDDLLSPKSAWRSSTSFDMFCKPQKLDASILEHHRAAQQTFRPAFQSSPLPS